MCPRHPSRRFRTQLGRAISMRAVQHADGRAPDALKEVSMSRKSVLVALASAFAFALPVSPGLAASPATPSVSTAGVSNVSYSSAILHGSVNPRGQETNYVFQYGPT